MKIEYPNNFVRITLSQIKYSKVDNSLAEYELLASGDYVLNKSTHLEFKQSFVESSQENIWSIRNPRTLVVILCNDVFVSL